MTIEDEQWFWSIIEQSLPHAADREAQLTALHAALSKLDPPALIRFGSVFEQLQRKSYAWSLWGAAYVIMGGASDDSFEYFRVWLISRGRTVFEAALRDPDALARLIPADFAEALDFEELAYLADDIFIEKAGREAREDEITRPSMAYVEVEPSGEPFEDSEAALAKRYPRLWARFGRAPLM